MRWFRQGLQTELRPMLRLAGPVVLAELGWMAMGVVDTVFVGRLGASAIGAVSLGNAFFFAVAIFGMGLLLGLDTLVSQAFGAGRREECHRWLVQGLYLCLVLGPLVMLLLFASDFALGRLGVHPDVLGQVGTERDAAQPGLIAKVMVNRVDDDHEGHVDAGNRGSPT